MIKLPFDPKKTAKEIVEDLESKGIRVNVSIPKTLLIDCNSIPDDARGYKIRLDAPYPNGKPFNCSVYAWNEMFNRSEQREMVDFTK